ncbi:MAG: NAD(P)-dependent oxidoreductase [Chitinophagaceae bacterium]
MAKAAIIGANGFLGRNIAKAHLLQKDEVWAVYHRSSDKVPVGCTLVKESEIDSVKDIAFDFIYIAIGSHASKQAEFVQQNIFINQLLYNLQFRKVIFVSSIAVYGNQENVIELNSPFHAPSIYGQAKLMGEFIVSGKSSYGIIRFTYLYGPGMSTNSLMPAWVKSAVVNKEIKIFGTGARVNDYLYIDDAVNLCLAVARSEGNQIAIGATGQSVSNADLAKNIKEIVTDTNISFTGEDKSPSFRFDIKKTTEQLNWKPVVSFKDGLKNLVTQFHADTNLQ